MIRIDLPPDVRAYVLDVQGKKKVESGRGFYSQEQAIIHIIKDHMLLKGYIPKPEIEDGQPPQEDED